MPMQNSTGSPHVEPLSPSSPETAASSTPSAAEPTVPDWCNLDKMEAEAHELSKRLFGNPEDRKRLLGF